MKTYCRRAALGLASTLVLAACATTTPEEALENIDVPAVWASDSEKSTENLPLNWLESFNDPALNALVLEAMNNNNDLGAAASRVEIARQSAVATRASLLPTLGLSGSGTQNDAAAPVFNPTTGQTVQGSRDFYRGSLSSSWEIDIWARLTDQTRGAYLNKAAAEADFAASRLSIAGGVTRSWYAVIATRLQRELAERDVETGKANLRITERRYEHGVSSSLDVRLARSSLAASEASLLSSKQAELETIRALEVLLGRYPNAELADRETLPTLTTLVGQTSDVTALGTPQSLLERRPDILAAERRMRAAGLDARAAKKALLPSLSLSGNGTVQTSQFVDLFDIEEVAASVTASVFQPIFQGGRLRAQAKLQQANAEQAVYNYVATVLNAFQEVENAITAETLLAAREEALRLAYEEAKASEELTERQYLSGTRNIFNLINAQQRRIQNEAQYINATQQRLNNRVGLYIALGGTFDAGAEKFEVEGVREGKEASPSLFRRWLQQIPGLSADTQSAGADQ